MSTASETDRHVEPDLTAFLMAHGGFRTEFGLLAEVVERPRDEAHRALIEDQIAFVVSYLHHHHHEEDTFLWPLIVSRAPQTAALLDVLTEQHEEIDPHVTAAADRTRPAAERAAAMRRLHDALGRHLDDEERIAVPLIRTHITAAEWNAHGEEVIRSFGRTSIPRLFGWLCAASDPAAVRRSARQHPLPVRLLFRFVWWPKYRRRHTALYGPGLRRSPDRG